MPLVLAASFALACAPRDREAEIRLEKLAAERRNLEATFDRLEDRLVVSQARVRFWRELRVRHESVSAIACASQDEHAERMASHVLPPSAPPRRSRVAAVSTAPAARVPAAGASGGSR